MSSFLPVPMAVPRLQLVGKHLLLEVLKEGLLEVAFLEYRFHNTREWALPNTVGDQRLHRVA